MSLILKLQLNHLVLAVVSAQRIRGGENPDDINTYKIALMDYRDDPEGEHTILGETTHRYGDPAEVLAHKALEAVLLHRDMNNNTTGGN